MNQRERKTGQIGENEEKVYRLDNGEFSPYTPTENVEEKPKALLFVDNLWPQDEPPVPEAVKEIDPAILDSLHADGLLEEDKYKRIIESKNEPPTPPESE